MLELQDQKLSLFCWAEKREIETLSCAHNYLAPTGALREGENTGVQKLCVKTEQARMVLLNPCIQRYLKPITISELLNYLSHKFYASPSPPLPPHPPGLSMFDLDFLSLPVRGVLNYRWGRRCHWYSGCLHRQPQLPICMQKKGWLMWGQGSLDMEAKRMGLWGRARQENGHAAE